MKLLKKIFKKKEFLREKKLLEDFEKGKILQVDNNIDNKEYFEKK